LGTLLYLRVGGWRLVHKNGSRRFGLTAGLLQNDAVI
jgi:hypothetical protein